MITRAINFKSRRLFNKMNKIDASDSEKKNITLFLINWCFYPEND